jgi:beta-phosphoglucomutase family hydrolase
MAPVVIGHSPAVTAPAPSSLPRSPSLDSVDAWLLDMDGVLTDSARVHAAAWKRSFDEVLPRIPGADARPFELPGDYERHVDGKLREDGVRDFLASRGVTLPEGSPADPPGALTVQGVAAAKNDKVLAAIAEDGVEAYPGAVRFLRACADAGVPCALVSSSANARQMMEAAGLDHLLAERVDGLTARELGLRGKPAPDSFLEAARRLGVPPARAAVAEDALAGVAAGRAGRFGLVVGVDRRGERGHADELLAAGADVVVDDLGDLVP